MHTTRVTLSEFQSFDQEGAVVERLNRFNIFVGPNNVGKSKLLQALKRLQPKMGDEKYLIDTTGEDYRVRYRAPITEQIARSAFPEGTSGGPFGGGNWWSAVGKHLLTSDVELEVRLNSTPSICEIAIQQDLRINYDAIDAVHANIQK